MKVKVSSEVFEGIKWIIDAGIYNPFDWPQISTVLGASDYTAASKWIQENPQKYTEGVMNGFEVKIKVDDSTRARIDKYSPGWL